jgi:hypothetical protein
MDRSTRLRRLAAGCASIGAMALSVSVAAPARAAATPAVTPAAGDPLSYLPAANRAPLQTLLSRADSVRSAVASGSYELAIAAVLTEGGAAAPTAPSLPAPTADDVARVATLPQSLQQPVAGLWAAVRSAGELLGGVSLSELRSELASVDSALASYPQRALANAQSSSTGVGSPLLSGQAAGALTAPAPARPHADLLAPLVLQPATQHALATLPSAALLLGEALDRYLPALLAARGDATVQDQAASDGCDELDESPYLCVASSSGNTFTDDEMLLVALGGSNTYRNGAGAAPFLPPGAAEPLPVSLNLDLGGGTDAYAAPPSSIATDQSGSYPGLVMGQGAGVLGGLGMSVNLGGTHTYSATGELPPPASTSTPAPEALTIAQGAALDGAGFLFDSGDAVSYSATSPVMQAGGRPFVYAQGADVGIASTGAALVEQGGGNTSYTIGGGGYDNSVPAYTFTTLVGQGSSQSNGGPALLFDDGGADTFSVTTQSSTSGYTANPIADDPNFQVDAQGYASIGTAMLLEGGGAHTYTLKVAMQNSGSAVWGVEGQGSTDFAGDALLQDRGGPNSYDLEATLTHQETHVVTDACGCTSAAYRLYAGAGDPAYPGDLDAVGFPPVIVQGQGAVFVGIAALDNAAAATYRAVSTATMAVALKDRLSAPQAPASLDLHGYLSPNLLAQGGAQFGYPNESQTEAVLINRSGTASYNMLDSDAVRASATSKHGPRPIVSGRSAFQWGLAGGAMGGQGSSTWNADVYNGALGALLDLGGPADTITAHEVDSVTTTPNGGNAVAAGGFWTPVQGAGDGGLLVADGAAPLIVASPANGICPGSSPRGFGTWYGCDDYTTSATADPDFESWDFLGGSTDPGHASGYASAAAGALPVLHLSAPSSAVDDGAVPVSATLADASGKTLSGIGVHFSLQAALPVGVEVPDSQIQWLTMGQVDATTNRSGLARAQLPLALLALAGGEPSQLRFDAYRVMVTFDGAAGLYPHHVVSAITIADGSP